MNILRNSRGFTLLEVLMAVSIFSIALLLFSSYFVNSFTISKTSDRELVAMNLARQIAEQYKNKDYEDLNTEMTTTTPTPLTIEINGTTYIPKVDLEKLGLNKPKFLGDESTIQKISNNSTEGQTAPILITISIHVEEVSHPLATLHTMVVNSERNP